MLGRLIRASITHSRPCYFIVSGFWSDLAAPKQSSHQLTSLSLPINVPFACSFLPRPAKGNWAFRVAPQKCRAAAVPEADIEGWLQEQRALDEGGELFVSLHRFLFLAHAP
ncbi:unnamed protein product [Prorocentrum cordatum]|uniref:Uncharacterized protein n=1 Tax=Prorocentrum cordatum TaxID=2364126 RepID=A0ABN9X7W0_9DINO|nr:unnamed protein product [Polarella glacialis]